MSDSGYNGCPRYACWACEFRRAKHAHRAGHGSPLWMWPSRNILDFDYSTHGVLPVGYLGAYGDDELSATQDDYVISCGLHADDELQHVLQ